MTAVTPTIAGKILGKAAWETILEKTVEDMHPVASKSYRRKSAVQRGTGSSIRRSSLIFDPVILQPNRLSGAGFLAEGSRSGRCEGEFLAGIHLVAMRRDGT